MIDAIEAYEKGVYLKGMKALEKGDYTKALKLFMRGDKLHSAKAQIQIALMYFRALGVWVHYDGAYEYFKKALKNGSDIAQKCLDVFDEAKRRAIRDTISIDPPWAIPGEASCHPHIMVDMS